MVQVSNAQQCAKNVDNFGVSCAICGIEKADDVTLLSCHEHGDYVCVDCCHDCQEQTGCDCGKLEGKMLAFGSDLEAVGNLLGVFKDKAEPYSAYRQRIVAFCKAKSKGGHCKPRMDDNTGKVEWRDCNE